MDTERNHYIMATNAAHVTGDLSSKNPDLAVVYEDRGDFWVGNWVTGFGFINVWFPKSTSRELSWIEKKWLETKEVHI